MPETFRLLKCLLDAYEYIKGQTKKCYNKIWKLSAMELKGISVWQHSFLKHNMKGSLPIFLSGSIFEPWIWTPRPLIGDENKQLIY